MTTYNKFLNKPDNNQIINSLQNENKFLKDELNEETKKLKQVIENDKNYPLIARVYKH